MRVRAHILFANVHALVLSSVEADGQNIFGDVKAHAAHKYLLSLEGHSFWSFRLRALLHLNSAVLHQDTPCHEFWHIFLRPYEHYLPLTRNLSNLMETLRYARAHDDEVQEMVRRTRALAPRILSKRAVLGYVRELLTQYAALQTERVQLHADATPLAQLAGGWAAAGPGGVAERHDV